MQKRSNSEILGNSLVPYSNYDLPELPLNKELCSFKAITRSFKKKKTKRKNNATHRVNLLMPVNFKRATFLQKVVSVIGTIRIAGYPTYDSHYKRNSPYSSSFLELIKSIFLSHLQQHRKNKTIPEHHVFALKWKTF